MKLNKKVEFVVFWAAATPLLAKAFQHLRYQEFALARGFEPENAEQLERDEYDQHCYYLLTYYGGQLAGGCRLINGLSTKLPMEKYVNQEIDRNSFEVSRYLLNSSLQLTHAERSNLQEELDRQINRFALNMDRACLYVNMRQALFRTKNNNSPFKFKQIGEKNIHPGAGVLIPACHQMETTKTPAANEVFLAA